MEIMPQVVDHYVEKYLSGTFDEKANADSLLKRTGVFGDDPDIPLIELIDRDPSLPMNLKHPFDAADITATWNTLLFALVPKLEKIEAGTDHEASWKNA